MTTILQLITDIVTWFFELIAAIIGNADPTVAAIGTAFVLLLVLPSVVGAVRGFLSMARRGKAS